MPEGMNSRTRPALHLVEAPEPDPDVRALRAIRRATRDYLVVLDAAVMALTDAIVKDKRELYYLRSQVLVATGKRGHASFGTPIALEHMLTHLLGEAADRCPSCLSDSRALLGDHCPDLWHFGG